MDVDNLPWRLRAINLRNHGSRGGIPLVVKSQKVEVVFGEHNLSREPIKQRLETMIKSRRGEVDHRVESGHRLEGRKVPDLPSTTSSLPVKLPLPQIRLCSLVAVIFARKKLYTNPSPRIHTKCLQSKSRKAPHARKIGTMLS